MHIKYKHLKNDKKFGLYRDREDPSQLKIMGNMKNKFFQCHYGTRHWVRAYENDPSRIFCIRVGKDIDYTDPMQLSHAYLNERYYKVGEIPAVEVNLLYTHGEEKWKQIKRYVKG